MSVSDTKNSKSFLPHLKYEYVCTDKFQNIIIRMWDPLTKKSSMYKVDCNDYVQHLFVEDNNGNFTSHINTKQKLKKVTFQSHKEYKEAVKEWSKDPNIVLYGNSSKPLSFIKDHFVPSITHNHDIRVWFLDIEVAKGPNGYSEPTEATNPITLIQIYDTYLQKFIVFGIKSFTEEYQSRFGEVKYYQFQNERELLENFLRLLEKLDPFGLSGFANMSFDIPYLTNRLEKLNFDINRLSPVGIVYKETKENPILKRFYQHCSWIGRAILDYQVLHPKYTYLKLPDNTLETVLTTELGEEKGKVQYDFYDLDAMYRGDYTQYDITEDNKDSLLSVLKIQIEQNINNTNNSEHQNNLIQQFQQEAYNMFVKYGIRDIEGLVELDQKTNYIQTAKNIAYRCGVNIDDVLGTLVQWKQLMYNKISEKDIILPLKQQYGIEGAIYLGGWTTSKPGKYKEVKSIDFSSLYPNVAITLNAGMDTYIKPENVTQEELKFIDKIFYCYKDENKEFIKENDNIFEMEYFKHLIEHKEEIHQFLSIKNRTISAGGIMYDKENQSAYAELLSAIYKERKVEQKMMATASDELEKIKQVYKD